MCRSDVCYTVSGHVMPCSAAAGCLMPVARGKEAAENVKAEDQLLREMLVIRAEVPIQGAARMTKTIIASCCIMQPICWCSTHPQATTVSW